MLMHFGFLALKDFIFFGGGLSNILALSVPDEVIPGTCHVH
jgi:hypothetical protein